MRVSPKVFRVQNWVFDLVPIDHSDRASPIHVYLPEKHLSLCSFTAMETVHLRNDGMDEAFTRASAYVCRQSAKNRNMQLSSQQTFSYRISDGISQHMLISKAWKSRQPRQSVFNSLMEKLIREGLASPNLAIFIWGGATQSFWCVACFSLVSSNAHYADILVQLMSMRCHI